MAVDIREKPINGVELPRLYDLHRLRTLHFMDSVLCEFFINRFERRKPVISPLLSVADVEEFIDARPEIDCDVAFAESLYHASRREYQSNAAGLRDMIFACQTAARWKFACAQYKTEPDAAVVAQRQLVLWLERIASDADARLAAHTKGVTAADVALARCAGMDAKFRLAKTERSEPAKRTAINEGATVAAELLEMIDSTPPNGPLDPYQFDFTWTNAADLLIAKAHLDGGADGQRIVLERQVGAFSNLVAKIGRLYASGERGGESEKFDLARINLALAEARLARAHGDEATVRRALHDAVPLLTPVSALSRRETRLQRVLPLMVTRCLMTSMASRFPMTRLRRPRRMTLMQRVDGAVQCM